MQLREYLLEDLVRRVRYFVTGYWEERLLAQWVTSIMIAVHWGLGIAIVVGGRPRFSSPSFQPLIDMVGGQTWVWGFAIVVSAVLMMTPFKWPNCLGLLIGIAWMNMWVALFATAVVTSPHAAATPIVAYAGFAMIDAALLTARVLGKNRE